MMLVAITSMALVRHMWQQAAILTGFALLLVTVSVKRFSKTMG
jgi:hypothetical protein